MAFQELCDLLECDDLVVTSEEQVFESAMAWIRNDLNGRRQYVSKLMSNVRLPTLRADYIKSHVQGDPLVNNDQECIELIFDAYSYQVAKEAAIDCSGSPRATPRICLQTNILIIGGSTHIAGWLDLWEDEWHARTSPPTQRIRYVQFLYCCLNVYALKALN